MKRTPRIIFFSALCLFAVATANAQPKREEPSRAFWKSEPHALQLQEQIDLIGENQLVEAEQATRQLVARFSDPYEKAQALLVLGYASSSQEKYAETVQALQRAVELDALANHEHFDTTYQVANMYYVLERYQQSIEWIERWFEQGAAAKTDAHVLHASALAQLERHADGVTAIDAALGLASSLGEQPKESWYRLKIALLMEQTKVPEALEVAKVLLRLAPEKTEYWTQLASLHVALEQDEEALSILALAHRQGLLSREADLVRLANLYGFMEIPFRAAETMQQGLDQGLIEHSRKRWEFAANAWLAAQERDRALEAYERAAELSLDGEIDLRRGYILLDLERWSDAEAALSDAQDKGGLDESEIEDVILLTGIARLEQGDHQGARQAFEQAMTAARTEAAAQQWINHLNEMAALR